MLYTNNEGVLHFDATKYSVLNSLNVYWSYGEQLEVPIMSTNPTVFSLKVNLPSNLFGDENHKWKYAPEPIIFKVAGKKLLVEGKDWYFEKYESN